MDVIALLQSLYLDDDFQLVVAVDTQEREFEDTVVGGFRCQPQSRDGESDLIQRPPATTDNNKKGVIKYLSISSFAS